MKKKLLCIGLIAILIAMVFVLTGCGSNESGENSADDSASIANEIQTAVKSAVDEVYEEDSSILVKNVQEKLDDKYTILGVNTASGDGILSVKDYIDPSTTLPTNQAYMSIADSVDYLIIYDSNADKEFRVRIFRQTTPPYVSCGDDSEITK